MPDAEPRTLRDLACEPCIPCRAGAPALAQAVVERLLPLVPGWSLAADGRSIARRYGFGNFAEAFAFVAVVAALAEEAGHHPDLGLGWGYVTASLHTHAIGGLHRNDLVLAAGIEQAFARRKEARP